MFMKQQLKDHMLSQLVSAFVVADPVQGSMIAVLKLLLSQVFMLSLAFPTTPVAIHSNACTACQPGTEHA